MEPQDVVVAPVVRRSLSAKMEKKETPPPKEEETRRPRRWNPAAKRWRPRRPRRWRPHRKKVETPPPKKVETAAQKVETPPPKVLDPVDVHEGAEEVAGTHVRSTSRRSTRVCASVIPGGGYRHAGLRVRQGTGQRAGLVQRRLVRRAQAGRVDVTKGAKVMMF